MQGVAHSQKSFPLWYLAWLKDMPQRSIGFQTHKVNYFSTILVLLNQYFPKTSFCKVCFKYLAQFVAKNVLFILFWKSTFWAKLSLSRPNEKKKKTYKTFCPDKYFFSFVWIRFLKIFATNCSSILETQYLTQSFSRLYDYDKKHCFEINSNGLWKVRKYVQEF